MAGPDEVVVSHRKGATIVYLFLMAGYLTYCALTIVTTFGKLAEPPISSTEKEMHWPLPDIAIGPSERYAPDFNSPRFFSRCVFQESHFTIHPDFRAKHECSAGRCFCDTQVVKHPTLPGAKRLLVGVGGLAAISKGASLEIYLEFPQPDKVVCPTISDLLNDGRDVAMPIVCDRTMVVDLYSQTMYNATKAKGNDSPPAQGKMAPTAARHDFPMNNKFWLSNTQLTKYKKDGRYYSGAPGAEMETEDIYETTGYSEHLSFDSTHVNYLNANKLDFLLLTVRISDIGKVLKHTELNPMDWTILLGQLGGFWVVVTILFRVVYVPKAYMVPRWKKDEADLKEEMDHEHTEKLWQGAVRRQSVQSTAQGQASYPLTPAQRVTSYPPQKDQALIL